MSLVPACPLNPAPSGAGSYPFSIRQAEARTGARYSLWAFPRRIADSVGFVPTRLTSSTRKGTGRRIWRVFGGIGKKRLFPFLFSEIEIGDVCAQQSKAKAHESQCAKQSGIRPLRRHGYSKNDCAGQQTKYHQGQPADGPAEIHPFSTERAHSRSSIEIASTYCDPTSRTRISLFAELNTTICTLQRVHLRSSRFRREHQDCLGTPFSRILPACFSENHGGPCGIRDHETDWLTLENALPRASSPRRTIER